MARPDRHGLTVELDRRAGPGFEDVVDLGMVVVKMFARIGLDLNAMDAGRRLGDLGESTARPAARTANRFQRREIDDRGRSVLGVLYTHGFLRLSFTTSRLTVILDEASSMVNIPSPATGYS
jgi:hypothetical protein